MREEDPEAGMGVVPAHDVVFGIEPVALAGDLLPGIVGVGEAGLGVGVVLGLERLGDPDEGLAGGRVDALLAQQDSAQLDGRVAQGVAFDGVGGPAIEEDRQVGRPGNLVGHAREPPVAVGPRQALRLADLISPKMISSPLTGLIPHPELRSPRSDGQEEEARIRPGRRPARYRKAECRRGKRLVGQRRTFVDAADELGTARLAAVRADGLGRLDLDARPHDLDPPPAPRAVDRDDQLAVQDQAEAARPVAIGPRRRARTTVLPHPSGNSTGSG